MRFSAEILLNGEKPIIPSDYRRNILYLIKDAINAGQGGDEIFKKYCIKETGKIEPFTFSVSFKADEAQNRKEIIRLAEPWIKLHFSASNPVFLKYVYDGLIQSQKDYPLFPELKAKVGPFYCRECSILRCTGCKLKVTIGQVNIEPEKILHDNELLFKTCSPIIVPDTNELGRSSDNDTADSPMFEEKLYHCLKSMCKVLLDDEPALARKDFAAEFTNFEKIGVRIYSDKGTPIEVTTKLIEATAGIIRIKAPAPVMQLIYDAGLGAQRSQGFGMLEIIE